MSKCLSLLEEALGERILFIDFNLNTQLTGSEALFITSALQAFKLITNRLRFLGLPLIESSSW